MIGSAWYARNGTDAANAMRASSEYVSQCFRQDSQVFNLVQFAGENLSWEEADRLVLYSTIFAFEMADVDLTNVLHPSRSGLVPGVLSLQSSGAAQITVGVWVALFLPMMAGIMAMAI